jgi:KDO2-lipid IV(A) lauroyltransferase
MREWLEFAFVWSILRGLGALPRPVARFVAARLAAFVFPFRPKLKKVALFNLSLAFPDWTPRQRRQTFRLLIRNLGWMAAEFTQFPKHNRHNIDRVIVLDGFENYSVAEQRGKGVLFLTGHTGAWELMPFAFALYHHPIYFLARAIQNPRVDRLVNAYRCASGNWPIEKNQSARAILRALAGGASVGILADHNTLPEEAVFVDFFGIPASTTTGIARFALRTGAAVVPGYSFWDERLRKYRLRFEPAVDLVHTGDEAADIVANTKRYTKVIENYVRAHPDQWLWVHKRWKNRPEGEPSLYPF